MKKAIIRILKKNKHIKKFLKYCINVRNEKRYQKNCKKNAVCENMIIFESFMGRKYADSPKAIYEGLLEDEHFRDYIFVWSFKNPEEKLQLEKLKNAVIVKHRSKQYYEYYSKAKYIVSNSRIDNIIKKREEQIYIQTWHGTPLKRLGYDIKNGDNALHSQEDLCNLYKLDCERYTYLLSPSKFSSEKFSSAFNLPVNNPQVEIVEEGYPRNDFLSNYTEEDVKRIKKALNIEENHKKIILYAPTWRDNQYENSGYSYQIAVDFEKLRHELGDDYIILFRAHYFIAHSFDFLQYDGFIYNVSDYEDINDLYIIADVLITDYSSVFFDYSILKRPILFYMYDLDSYRNEIRGFYISLEDLPGPIIETEEELIQELNREFLYDEKYKAFNEKFTYLEDGKATQRVIERCFVR